MTYYKRYETITAWDIQYIHWNNWYVKKDWIIYSGRFSVWDILPHVDFDLHDWSWWFWVSVFSDKHKMCYWIQRIEIEKPEEVFDNTEKVMTEKDRQDIIDWAFWEKSEKPNNLKDDNEIINEWLDRLYGWEINKIDDKLVYEEESSPTIFWSKINELIDQVNYLSSKIKDD